MHILIDLLCVGSGKKGLLIDLEFMSNKEKNNLFTFVYKKNPWSIMCFFLKKIVMKHW